jgi:ribonucleotide reductase alpha subunit
MRVAIGIHKDDNDMKDAIETYDLLSKKYMTHATPTLFNAGSTKPQLSSCFLMAMQDDSIKGIYDTLSDCAQISKFSGGIGIHVSNVRCRGGRIRSTNGVSDGIIPMLRVFNSTARYVNQSGKRSGSIAIYLEPWHGDVEDFLELRKNTGSEESRCHDLFLALWMNDLFMHRVENDDMWSLMDPDECPGLQDVYGDAFRDLYEMYERKQKYIKRVPAQDLWKRILQSQIETGTPYIVYKDAVNSKSNHKHLGVIKSSNLCVAPETSILTDKGYIGISHVANQDVNVWNGSEWSLVKICKTGENQALVTVYFDNGMQLRCTPYHKFFIQAGEDVVVREARELAPGDTIASYDLPQVDGAVRAYIEWYVDRHPDLQCSSLRIQQEAFYSFQCIGVHPRLKVKRDVYQIELDYEGTKRLLSYLDYLPIRLSEKIPAPAVRRFPNVRVQSVDDLGEKADTYCFTEELKHAGMFNGVLTSQCSEIVQYTSPDETAVCNLGSLCLPSFVLVDNRHRSFDYDALHRVTQVLTRNLNKIIDVNFYPVESARASNMRHRPVGIGVQGLADVFAMLRIPFESAEARNVNTRIFETIYHAAVTASMELAKVSKTPYPSFQGSPASKGILQMDMWGIDPSNLQFDWEPLRADVIKHGLRNSLLVAPMPTASTASIMGNNESFEPYTTNIFKRKTMSGEFIVINKHLMKDLLALGLWTDEIKDAIIACDGSVQTLPDIPDDLKALYKTVWEIKQRALIDLAADRGAFVDQSQSLSIFMENPTFQQLTSMHFYGWKKGLKTGMYYLRTRSVARTQKFTLDPNVEARAKEGDRKCTLVRQDDGNGGVCLACQG